MNDDVIYIEDVINIFGNKVSRGAIYSLIREKKIPASKVGKRYLFSRTVVQSFVNKSLGIKPLS